MTKLEDGVAEGALFRQQCLIAGQWRNSNDNSCLEVSNPATGEILGAVPSMGQQETAEAIDAAHAALPQWRAKTAKDRAAILRRWYELIMEHQDELAAIMTAEQGKPLAEAKGEIAYAASFVEWFAEEGKRAYGDTIPTHQSDRRLLTIKQGVGVTAAITPWNFPAAMATRKAAPALAAGCTMVLKPASKTPFTALALGELAQRAGIPAGVLNIVTGSPKEIAEQLTQNTKVRKLSFTGSTDVGRQLMAACAKDIKNLSLELGGNAPFIVFEDADIEAAVEGAVQAKFRNNGQTCVCANRIYVHDSVYMRFSELLCKAVSALKVGAGVDKGVDLGPLIDESAVEKVRSHIEDATRGGACIALGGREHEMGGHFFEPTVLLDVLPTARLCFEETFGPVAPLIRFESEEQVIKWANDTEFGLASYLYTRDIGRAFRVSEALEYGMVGVNTGLISTELAPFGGIKSSGLGREGGKEGLEEYLETKYISIAGL